MVAITFKVSPEEARESREAARASRRSLSAHIRAAVIPAKTIRRPKLIRDHATGLPTLIMPANTPPMTSEAVRAALSDLP